MSLEQRKPGMSWSQCSPAHGAAAWQEERAHTPRSLNKEFNGGSAGEAGEKAPLSPSNFNPAHPSQSLSPPMIVSPRCRPAHLRLSTASGASGASGAHHGAAGPGPHHDVDTSTRSPSGIARRSPRDTMDITHLLSSCRSPWSPRHFGSSRPGSAWAGQLPPRMTNTFEGGNLTRPTTQAGKRASPPAGKKAPLRTAAPARVQQASSGKAKELGAGSGSGRGELVQGSAAIGTVGGLAHLPVHLFVAAIGDGELSPDTPHKIREILQQVVKKVSKEQNTQVNVCGEGPLHIQLRVFVASSVEARTLKEYIHRNEMQRPCPFIMLAKQLPMAVMYDSATINPAHANVADRLRKQAKTRAIKLLREVIYDASSGVTAAMLRGRLGPMLPCQRLEALIIKRAAPLHADGESFISFPAVRRHGEGSMPSQVAPLTESSLHSPFPFESVGDIDSRGQGPLIKTEDLQMPAASAARQPGAHSNTQIHTPASVNAQGMSSAALIQQRMAEQHFPVSITVIAIGEGVIVRNTQPKLLNRLKQLISKVPKEHHCSIDLPKHGNVPLRLRLFVANSEDAKAAREYVSSNHGQVVHVTYES